MKKLFFCAAALAAALTVNAQGVDKVWNFTSIFDTDKTFNALDTVNPQPELIADELYTFGNTDKGFQANVGQSPKYFVEFLTEEDQDANKKVARLKSQGTGAVKVEDDKVDVKGALAFSVAGDSYVQVAAVSSSSSEVRRLALVTLAGEVVGTVDFDGNVGKKVDGEIVDAPFAFEYEGPATTLFLISMQNPDEDPAFKASGINYYKVAATNVVTFTMEAPLTALHSTAAAVKAQKSIENGRVVIRRNGVRFDALGQQF